jgi:hypothetical protein
MTRQWVLGVAALAMTCSAVSPRGAFPSDFAVAASGQDQAARQPRDRRQDGRQRPGAREERPQGKRKLDSGRIPGPVRQLGVIKNTDKAFEGYTLIAPMPGRETYLIRNDGQIVNQWDSDYTPGESAYLLPNGHLLRSAKAGRAGGEAVKGPGGGIQEFDWDGKLLWEYIWADENHRIHHDIEPLPNGNVLALVLEKKMPDELIQAGFSPNLRLPGSHIGADFVVEIEKTGPKSGRVVWEWHVWDHLAQNFDRTKDNYIENATDLPGRVRPKTEGRGISYSWNHTNSLAYNAKLDQVVVSARSRNEIWIIDHNTTTEEAAGPKGDLLYRWGNPAAYGRRGPESAQLACQHDAQWIDEGCPGAGNILIFENGAKKGYSRIVEIVAPLDKESRYPMDANGQWGPDKPVWTYTDPDPTTFYSDEVSGCQRLPNGNTLICAGVHGTLFEVTPSGETVWEYVSPVSKSGMLKQGDADPYDSKAHALTGIFKVRRYAPDYPGIKGKDLSPKGLLVENPENPVSPALRAPPEGIERDGQRRQSRGRGEQDARPPRGAR